MNMTLFELWSLLIGAGGIVFTAGTYTGKAIEKLHNGKYQHRILCGQIHKGLDDRLDAMNAELLRVRDGVHDLRDTLSAVHAIVKMRQP